MVRSLSKLVGEARPTEFHQMLATLASEGRLMRLYTQNVDGIDTSLPPLETSIPLSMKGPWPRTIQLHGGLEKMVCSKCNHLSEFQAALFEGPLPPPCTACMETDKVRTYHAGKRSHGIGRLRPRIVLYNEYNPDEEAIGTVVSSDLRTRPDALIVVGTSMKIPGVRRIVREMCGVVRGRKGGLTVWINHDSPPPGKDLENCWDLIVKGACDEVAARANMRRWNDDGVEFKTCTESEAERAKARAGKVNIVIESPPKKTLAPAIPTPGPSPKPPKLKLNLGPSSFSDNNTKDSTSSKLVVKSNKTQVHSKLGKEMKKRTAKPSAGPSTKITSAFKLTKPAQPRAKGLLNTKSKTIPQFTDETEYAMPMGPISPQAARNNGPVTGPGKILFPNLMKEKPAAVSLNEEIGFRDVKRKSDEIVSPTGSIPSGMSGLLN